MPPAFLRRVSKSEEAPLEPNQTRPSNPNPPVRASAPVLRGGVATQRGLRRPALRPCGAMLHRDHTCGPLPRLRLKPSERVGFCCGGWPAVCARARAEMHGRIVEYQWGDSPARADRKMRPGRSRESGLPFSRKKVALCTAQPAGGGTARRELCGISAGTVAGAGRRILLAPFPHTAVVRVLSLAASEEGR